MEQDLEAIPGAPLGSVFDHDLAGVRGAVESSGEPPDTGIAGANDGAEVRAVHQDRVEHLSAGGSPERGVAAEADRVERHRGASRWASHP